MSARRGLDLALLRTAGGEENNLLQVFSVFYAVLEHLKEGFDLVVWRRGAQVGRNENEGAVDVREGASDRFLFKVK